MIIKVVGQRDKVTSDEHNAEEDNAGELSKLEEEGIDDIDGLLKSDSCYNKTRGMT